MQRLKPPLGILFLLLVGGLCGLSDASSSAKPTSPTTVTASTGSPTPTGPTPTGSSTTTGTTPTGSSTTTGTTPTGSSTTTGTTPTGSSTTTGTTPTGSSTTTGTTPTGSSTTTGMTPTGSSTTTGTTPTGSSTTTGTTPTGSSITTGTTTTGSSTTTGTTPTGSSTTTGTTPTGSSTTTGTTPTGSSTTGPSTPTSPTTTLAPLPPVTTDPLLPVIMLDRTGVVLKETEAATQTRMMKITCTSSGGEALSVRLARITPSYPCSTCFTVLPCPSGVDFCLTYLAGQGTLNVRLASRYQVTYSCIDSDGRYSSSTADVFIEPNEPPYFEEATYPGLKVEGEISQTAGVTVQATDEDGDALTYSMVTYPDTSALEIDSLSGQIRVASGKSLKSECRNHYSAQVYVKDKYHTTKAGPIAVALNVKDNDQNQRPVITNLKGELRVREDAAEDSVVLEMGVVDEGDDVNADTMTYTMTTVPSSASSLFKLVENDKVLELQVESPQLDYETQPKTINLKITANDGFCDSETYDLNVKLVDVNEPPDLEPESQTLESCEGKVDIVPSWRATDPDKDDEIKFVQISPNEKGAFTINEKTGVISTTVDYGIDEGEAFEGEETLTDMEVTIRDKQGEEVTALVTIRFVDCNDNPPVFPQERAKRIEVNDCDTKADTVAGKVDDARDGDSAYNQNNVFAYSGQGAGAKVEPSGAIVLTKAMTAGEVISFQVVATDLGKVPGPLSSSPYFVSITALECTPPDPPDDTDADADANAGVGSGTGTEVDGSGRRIITGNANNLFSLPDVAVIASPGEDASKNRKNNFWDDSVGWVVMAAILGIALLALLIYLLWRFIWPALRLCFRNLPALCNKCKQRPPPRQVTPVKRQPPPPKRPSPPPGPAFIFGFWKETYSDDDYGKTFNQPTRQDVPGASKGPERVDTNTYDVDPIIPPSDPNAPSPPSSSCVVM
ncbi:uncharacterized protein [Littorina saxatilis]|uniref:uncharacterized protein isoform X2 n=1 Tax=Littorina saxatilis TaxID=31220 RepID=UPI0038B57715